MTWEMETIKEFYKVILMAIKKDPELKKHRDRLQYYFRGASTMRSPQSDEVPRFIMRNIEAAHERIEKKRYKKCEKLRRKDPQWKRYLKRKNEKG